MAVVSGLLGKYMSRVGLKLARGIKNLSIDLLMLLLMLSVPRHHNVFFQPVGRLSLFVTSLKYASAA